MRHIQESSILLLVAKFTPKELEEKEEVRVKYMSSCRPGMAIFKLFGISDQRILIPFVELV